jgi:hypothetical protein
MDPVAGRVHRRLIADATVQRRSTTKGLAMKRLFTATTALVLLAGAAQAAITARSVADALIADGYTRVEVKVGPTQMKVEAIRGTEKVETVYNIETGAVIKSETEAVDNDDNTRPGVSIRDRGRDFVGRDRGRDRADRDDRDDRGGKGRGRGGRDRDRADDDRDDDRDDDKGGQRGGRGRGSDDAPGDDRGGRGRGSDD